MKRIFNRLAFYLMTITGIASVITGALLINAPSGQLVGNLIVYFKYPLYNSFLIPGFFLFFFYGLLNINYALTLNRHRADFLVIIGQGVVMISLTLFHAMLVSDFNLLHGILTAIGVALVVCALIVREPLLLRR